MAADVIHVGLGVPYVVSSIAFSIALAVIFVLWFRSEGTLSIHSITTPQRELFLLGDGTGHFRAGYGSWRYDGYDVPLGLLVLRGRLRDSHLHSRACLCTIRLERDRGVLDCLHLDPSVRRIVCRLDRRAARTWRAQLGNRPDQSCTARHHHRACGVPCAHARRRTPTFVDVLTTTAQLCAIRPPRQCTVAARA